MNLKREVWTWAGLAVAALALLGGILAWQHKRVTVQGAIYLSTDPVAGAQVFKAKGCANCHAAGAGPDFAVAPGTRPSRASLPKLVTAMWNHAPRMWDRMTAERVPYPELSYGEMAELVAYLYMSGYIDPAGDPEHGQELFASKGCIRCHSVRGEGKQRGPDLAKSDAITNPMAWTQIMWNHAADMQERLRERGLAWPRFEEDELRDLYAYVRQVDQRPLREYEMTPADPENGWKVFQEKGCIRCHSLTASSKGHIGPDLGPDGEVPPTFFRFAESMLNHFPDMKRASQSQNADLPSFNAREMADVIAFIYSLRYLEPGGSPHVGESVFNWRGCSRCHGDRAEGAKGGPPLRGRGQNFTAVRLASILWRHGARMYQQNQKLGQNWPELEPTDIGNILAFLNSPVEEKR
ncbi:MAG: c-type cytochrome [Terriglobales bacterium]